MASAQFSQARIWRTINLLVGLPAAAAAAVAGGLALSGANNAGTVGVLAIASATLGSFQPVLGAQRRQTVAERCANSYLEIRNAARRLQLLDLDEMSYAQARRQLDLIASRQEEVNRTADPPSMLALRFGRRFVDRSKERVAKFDQQPEIGRADQLCSRAAPSRWASASSAAVR
ncbi:SLATT domain-containing protein [Amycolatopsis sp. NBC_01286]|uniref:SLATT domain-containing protein n=1 Tax=Amycolatopsis sp. NBC_01286 TaxID=2903560 RepID=UPI002E12A421|nr:SLATT domain-containing protein [Amycolatopsis sp. NBC_01286]